MLLLAGEVVVDEVRYGEGWRIRPGQALSLDPTVRDPDSNDDPSVWCSGEPSPGRPNAACPPPD